MTVWLEAGFTKLISGFAFRAAIMRSPETTQAFLSSSVWKYGISAYEIVIWNTR